MFLVTTHINDVDGISAALAGGTPGGLDFALRSFLKAKR